MKKFRFVLPNAITLSSVFCGFYSMVLSSRQDFQRAAILIVFAMFFDMLDGRVARMTKTQSAFGMQIDSLADVTSFGAAPALLAFHWTLHRADTWGLIACFAFLAAGTVRLARFNTIASSDSTYFTGLPIPGAAGILVSLVLAGQRRPMIVAATMVALAFLMVSTLRFRSFKALQLNGRLLLFTMLIAASSALVGTQLGAAYVLVWLLGCYVLMGIGEWLWQIRVPSRHD